MTDHAGPRRSECPPGTMLWRPPAFVTQFWHTRSGFGCRHTGKSMKQNGNLNHFKQLFFYKNSRQNRSSGAKTGLLWQAGATT